MKKICSVFLAAVLLATALIVPGAANTTGPLTVTQDFETATDSDFTFGSYAGSSSFSVATDDATHRNPIANSTKVLKYTPSTNGGYARVIFKNVELEKGHSYTISFKFCRTGSTVDTGTVIKLLTADVENTGISDDSAIALGANIGLGSNDSTYPSYWHDASKEFTATGKYLYLSCSGQSAGMIDNITIREIVPVNVQFKDAKGNTLCDTASGSAGNALTLPTPTKEGEIFVGWFTEATFENQFTSNVYPNEDTTLYAKFSSAVAETGFEATFTTGGGSGNDTAYGQYVKTGLNDGNVHGGNGSLAFPVTAPTAGSTRSLSLSKIDTNIKFTKGKTYKVSFWLKRGEAISGFESATNTQVTFFDTTSDNSWAKGIWDTGYNTSVKTVLLDQNTTTEWQQYTFYFTAGKAANAGETTYLCLAAINFKYGFYLDDIVVTEAENVTVDFKDPEDYSPLAEQAKGLPGSALTLPKPTKAGFNFVGWYTDADCNVSYTANVFPDENTTLFAKWLAKGTTGDIYREDFENTTVVSTNLNSSAPSDVAFTLVDATDVGSENVHGGTKALKYNAPTSRTGDAATLLISGRLKVGSNYHLSIWVRRDSSVTPGNTPCGINIGQSTKNSGYTGVAGELYASSTNLGYGGQMSANWSEYTLTFTAKNPYLVLFTNSDVPLYFDDITVSEVFTATVKFQNTDGSTIFEDKSGLYGSKMTVAIPEKEGKSFAGWYLDKNFEEAANTTYFPWNDATYYAKWLDEGCFEQSFEAWPYKSGTNAMSTPFSLYTAQSENDPNVYDGKHSVLFEDDRTNTHAITLFDNTMGKLKYGEKYYVTVHFKPDKCNWDKYAAGVNGSYHSIYYTTQASNAWTFTSQGPQGRYNPYAFYEDDIGDNWSGVEGLVTTTTVKDANGWLTMTYEITAVTDYIAMYMTISGSIYMDAITITPLPNGLIASDYESPYCEPFYNVLKETDLTASATGKKTVYKLELESRSDYIFSAQPKNGAKAYLAYDANGEQKVEGTLFNAAGKLSSSRLMTGFDGIFYLVLEGNATSDFDYLAVFKQKYGLAEDPTVNATRPVSNYENIPEQDAESGVETLSQNGTNANTNANTNAETEASGESPATGDVGLPLLAVLCSVLAAAAVILLKGGRKA